MSNEPVSIPLELIEALRHAQDVVVSTGAGISAESGIPTFRDAQTGLWAKYDPQELATPQAFRRNPKLVWEWYTWRRKLVSEAEPNAGHLALVEMEQKLPKFTLITQNVDGLHKRAGSKNVIELHGNIMRTKRFDDGVIVESWPETDEVPPRCPQTGSLLRPDVVWFHENLSEEVLAKAREATKTCDLFFTIGTSGLVQPAASLPMLIKATAKLVVINPDVTPHFSEKSYFLQGPAGKILPELVKATWPYAKKD